MRRRTALVTMLVVPGFAGCAAVWGLDDLTGEASTDGGESIDAEVADGIDGRDALACATPHCCNGTKDDDETDTDCGGSACAKCSTGEGCRVASDCASGKCASAGWCGCTGPLAFAAMPMPMPSALLKPNGIGAGDFDKDGKLDLVVAPYGTASCLFFPGKGAGDFGAPRTFACGNGMVTVADVNNDGKLDILGSAGIALGDGAGGFALPIAFPSVGGPIDQQIAFADFNGDGVRDFHAASYGAKGTFVFLQKAGSLSSVPGATGGFGAGAGAADLNGDHKTDLVAGIEYTGPTAPSGIVSALGNGDGTFANQVFQPTPLCDVRHLVPTDLNADGKLDLVVACGSKNAGIAVFFGNGDGTFGPLTHYGAFNGIEVGLLDLDGDGNVDVATTDVKSGVEVLLGRGDGTFGASLGFGAGKTPATLALGDFDGDGRPDIAAANVDSQDVTVLLNRCP